MLHHTQSHTMPCVSYCMVHQKTAYTSNSPEHKSYFVAALLCSCVLWRMSGSCHLHAKFALCPIMAYELADGRWPCPGIDQWLSQGMFLSWFSKVGLKCTRNDRVFEILDWDLFSNCCHFHESEVCQQWNTYSLSMSAHCTWADLFPENQLHLQAPHQGCTSWKAAPGMWHEDCACSDYFMDWHGIAEQIEEDHRSAPYRIPMLTRLGHSNKYLMQCVKDHEL